MRRSRALNSSPPLPPMWHLSHPPPPFIDSPLPRILRWAGVSLGHYLGIKYLKPAPTPPDHGLASLLLRESTLAGKRPRWLRVGHRPEHGLGAGVSIPPRENTPG